MTTQTSSAGWLTLHGVRLEVVERGRGRPILWLHGEEGLDAEARFLDLLAGHGCVIAPSHPGFGHSPDAGNIDTVDDLAYLYLDLLAERDARDAVVIGASLGGWIAAELAVKCTARLARLVLVAPLGVKWYIESNKVPPQFSQPPGYHPIASAVTAMKAGGAASIFTVFKNPAPLPEYIERGLVFAGNPDTVYRGIKKMYDHVGGFGHLLIMGQAGFLDHDETVKGMTLFAREVYPRLKELSGVEGA